VLSATASAKRWATVDHCGSSASQSRAGGSVLTHYKGCKSRVTVTLDTILGGAHQWPPGFASTLAAAINRLSGPRQAVIPPQ
jgi:poly(3-hydroxybutyrate) depolymerase